MNETRPAHIAAPVWLGVLLIVTGLAGLLGAFALSVEHIELLEHPSGALGCDLNPFLNCSGAIESDQGKLFGFPNPLLGLMAFPAPIIMGAMTLGRVAMPRWVWTVFSIGVLGGLAIVLYLAQQSIFFLGFVCPWCFLPVVVAGLDGDVRDGVPAVGVGLRLRRAAGRRRAAPHGRAVLVVGLGALARARRDRGAHDHDRAARHPPLPLRRPLIVSGN